MEKPIDPLLLLDIHHSSYLGWGVWCGSRMPELWTAETVERLERHPHYKMGLNLGGQGYEWSPEFARLIREWLARYPDRLCITGGDYAQPTACVRTGESNLRQLVFGLQAIEEALGSKVAIWTVSEPGNFSQLPQVLNELGYRGALLRIHGPGQRGSLTPRADVGSLWWQGPDGSRILAVPEYTEDRTTPKAAVPYSMWIMTRYRNANQAAGNYTLDDLWQWKQTQAAKGIQPVVMSKDDDQNNQFGNNNRCMIAGHLLAADTAGDPRFRWVTADELFAELEPTRVLAADPNLFETRCANFNDYGYQGNADWLADLQAEAALRLADWAVAMAAPYRAEDDEPMLRRAWSSHLMAQNHDLALKRSLDLSYHLQYDARRMAEGVRDAALHDLCARVDAGPGAGAIVVCNPLGWDRRDYVEIDLPESVADSAQPYVDGHPVAWEVVRRSVGHVVMGLIADVPGLGYRVYQLGPRIQTAMGHSMLRREADLLTVENGAYTAQLAMEQGGITGLWTQNGKQVAGAGSVSLRGEIGGSEVCSQGRIVGMEEGPLSVMVREAGRVGPYHRYEILYRFVRGLHCIQMRVYLAADYVDGDPGAPAEIGRVGRKLGLSLCLGKAVLPAKCMRYQPLLVWPYDLEMDPVFAAPYWVDVSGDTAGIAWLNDGALGYQYDAAEGRLDNILARGFISEQWYDVGLLPHDGDWLEGQSHPWGLGFGNPLHAVWEPAHKGDLPGQGQLCTIAPQTVTVSSTFRSGGRNYVRLYEHAGQAAEIRITNAQGLLPVQSVDLRLRPTRMGSELGPYRLRTLALPE